MQLINKVKTRLKFAWQGPQVIGEYYRPILSSLHVAGAHIETELHSVMYKLGLDYREDDAPPVLSKVTNVFPELYDSDNLTRELIWRVIRETRPDFVVETGVANGLSSITILAALEANAHGQLYSFDIDSRAEASVPVENRSRWHFQLLDSADAKSQLRSAVLPLEGQLGVWFHDSDHNYAWQRFEYDLATSIMGPGSTLISDDADGTEAFADFCVSHHHWLCTALFDTRKVCGLARRP